MTDILQMTPLQITWFLLWDRHYGWRIQERIKSGGELDYDFCKDIEQRAKAEYRELT
ncbi:hypothetical protein LCGC14_2986150, partial [marine sediment metagenome]